VYSISKQTITSDNNYHDNQFAYLFTTASSLLLLLLEFLTLPEQWFTKLFSENKCQVTWLWKSVLWTLWHLPDPTAFVSLTNAPVPLV